MRFGTPLYDPYSSPGQWIDLVKKKNHGAAYSPISLEASDSEAIAYGKAAKAANIVISEQGVWSVNCLSYDAAERGKAIAACIRGLELAELLGARCCVALSGSRAEKWDGPHPDNFSEETFRQVVANTQVIIDAVQPKNTFFTMEPMPWTPPYDAKNQLRLLEAVDRPACGVHYDPVNLVYSPDRYYHNGRYIRDFVEALASVLRVVHAKDILLRDTLTLHLDEAMPGQGALDYDTLLSALNGLDPDLPLMAEHLGTAEEYERAEAWIRGKAKALGLSFIA